MPSTRTKTGMLKKIRPGDTITVTPYMKMKGQKLVRLKKSKIHIISGRRARRVKDGLEFKRKGKKWIYFAK